MVIGNTISAAGDRVRQLVGLSDGNASSSAEVPPVLNRTGFEGSLEGSEVIGRSPMSYVAASEAVATLMGKQTSNKLAKYGIENIQPEEWYPLDVPLAMLYDMREDYGEGSMQNMGRNVPQHVEFPPELSGVEDAMRSIDQAYHQNHRGGDIGFYEFHAEASNEGTMICENPYPCEFDQGLIKGVAQKFADSPVTVEEVGDQCRSEGGQHCEYHVDWI